MSSRSLRFNTKDQAEFFKVLSKRINAHFKEKKISRHANTNMVLKTTLMVSLYFIPLIILLTGTVAASGTELILWTIMGAGMSGIGLAVMHDANHGSYSKNKKVNSALGYLLNFLGGWHVNWKIQHNVLHHSYTNIEDYDEDIKKPGIFRMSPYQKQMWHFKYQAFYAPVLYGLLSFYWFVAKDYIQLNRYSKDGLLEKQGLTFKNALTRIIINKTWYFVLLVVLPMYMTQSPWWITLVGFGIMHVITGLSLALIFQSAHVIEETEFFEASEEGDVKNNWAIHQMRTTANFAKTSRLFSWYIGGLNFQIEHHLFPNICHVHYRSISQIVKETAAEYDVPYHENVSFMNAVKSHFSLLNKLGKGKELEEVNIAA